MADPAITRYRGDTIPDQFTVMRGTAPENITDATGGVVQFPFGNTEANTLAGKYFFGVKMTDTNGKVQTLAVGTYTFKQGI